MSLLSGKRVVALGDMAERPLGQFFASLGAAVQSMAADAAELDAAVAAADFLLDPWVWRFFRTVACRAHGSKRANQRWCMFPSAHSAAAMRDRAGLARNWWPRPWVARCD
jgi:hypothetical protein